MSALVQVGRPRPSGSHQWVGGGCTGAPKWQGRYERESGPAAAEGTRLHEVARQVLVGEIAITDVPVDDREIIQPYTDDVWRFVNDATANSVLHIEQLLVWEEDRRLQGTPDAVIFDHGKKHVTIFDLKTGWGVVDAVGNWQMLCYAAMCVPAGWSMHLRVAQPKPWHPLGYLRGWELSWGEFVPFRQRIATAVRDCYSHMAKLLTGPHCRYCDAIHACPAARAVTSHAEAWADRQPHELPTEHIARELQQIRDTITLLEHRAAGLEEIIYASMRQGVAVPFVSKERASGGKVTWADADNAAAILEMWTGEDHRVSKLPTPKQLIKLGVAEKLINPLTETREGKFKLVIDLDGSHARKKLGPLPTGPLPQGAIKP